jgi:hypothetical protein
MGLISSFLYSLLTGRVFLVYWPGCNIFLFNFVKVKQKFLKKKGKILNKN